MRGRSRLRAKVLRLATYGSFVAETLGGSLTAATAAVSALTFFFTLVLAPAGTPSPGLFMVLFFTHLGYSVIALTSASAMVSDLRSTAQVFLSQPLSRTTYALAWLAALLTSMLATFSAMLLSFAVIDPSLLSLVGHDVASAWLLDGALLSLVLLLAALWLRRASALIAVWAVVEFGVPLLLSDERLAQVAVLLRPLYSVLWSAMVVGGSLLAASALLAATLTLLLLRLAKTRLEV